MKKVSFEQSLEVTGSKSSGYLEWDPSMQREQQMQRLMGRRKPSLFKEHQGTTMAGRYGGNFGGWAKWRRVGNENREGLLHLCKDFGLWVECEATENGLIWLGVNRIVLAIVLQIDWRSKSRNWETRRRLFRQLILVTRPRAVEVVRNG